MDYRHKITKEVRSVSGNSVEGRDLAKSDDWDKCPTSEIDDDFVEMPPGVQDAPTVEPVDLV